MFRRRVPRKYRGLHMSTYLDNNNQKILVLTKIGRYGTEYQRKFSIKNLLNENNEVTEQTLEEEKNLFRTPLKREI